MSKALYVLFEGPTGAGKTTQAKMLVDRLIKIVVTVLFIKRAFLQKME